MRTLLTFVVAVVMAAACVQKPDSKPAKAPVPTMEVGGGSAETVATIDGSEIKDEQISLYSKSSHGAIQSGAEGT